LPRLADALAKGRVSAGHVDAIADAHRKLDDAGKAALLAGEDLLLTAAVDSSVGKFSREVQALARTLVSDEGRSRQEKLRAQRNVRRTVDRDTGMHKTILTLDPETDAKVWTSIHAAIGQERSKPQDPDANWDHVVSDAVVRLLTETHAAGEPRVPEVIVLIDLDTMRTGVHDDTVSETSEGVDLPPDVIRRMACEGDIIPAVLGERKQVVDLGRAKRLATNQRNTLRAMYRACAFPGCTAPFDHCRVHHVAYWENGGRSDLANIVPLCTEHHHAVHEGGWKLELDADRTIRLHRPDGNLHFEGITIDRSKSA